MVTASYAVHRENVGVTIALEECTDHSVRAGTLYRREGHKRAAWEFLVDGDTTHSTHAWTSRLENMDGMRRWTHAVICQLTDYHHPHADEEAVLEEELNLCLAFSCKRPHSLVKGLEMALESHIHGLLGETVLFQWRHEPIG